MPSILLVTIDTLRADHLGCYGYFRETSPNLDRLARRAAVFENVVSPMATTLPVHVSLLTGTSPGRHGIQGNFEHFHQPFRTSDGNGLETLAQMLGAAGYRTAAFVSATPLKAESGISAGFQTFDQPETASRRATATTELALRWLAEDGGRPFFLWIHYWDPHYRYQPPARYRDIYRDDEALLIRHLEERHFPNPRSRKVLKRITLYDGEIRYTDSELGRVLDFLEDRGLFEQMAIVVTSDHGEGLGQHGWRGHGRIYNEQLFVPLVMKFPARSGLDGRRIEHLASLVDFAPTLVEVLDLPLSDSQKRQFEGINLMAEERRHEAFAERVRRQQAWESGDKYALMNLEWKYAHLTEGPDELYRISADRAETRNVIGEQPEIAERMLARIREILAAYAVRDPGLQSNEDISPEIREELRTLGYVE
jgi:arylsulfatase